MSKESECGHKKAEAQRWASKGCPDCILVVRPNGFNGRNIIPPTHTTCNHPNCGCISGCGVYGR